MLSATAGAFGLWNVPLAAGDRSGSSASPPFPNWLPNPFACRCCTCCILQSTPQRLLAKLTPTVKSVGCKRGGWACLFLLV